MPPVVRDGFPWRRPVFAVLLLAAAVLGSRGITDESQVMLGADMARYLMNGVFVHDLIGDGAIWNASELARTAEVYYAKYPALSLGHHPPLPYLTLVPFYAIFGVSVFAARLAATMWFVLACWGLHLVARRLFDDRVALVAVALFVTNAFVLRFSQYVLSETPMVAMVLLACAALLRYSDSREPRWLIAFAVAVTASVYAKQTAALMFPVYAGLVLAQPDWRRLMSRRFVLISLAAVALALPAIAITLGFAPGLVEMMRTNLGRLGSLERWRDLVAVVGSALTTQLAWPALLLTAAGAAVAIGRRHRSGMVLVLWVLCFLGGSILLAGRTETARYAFGAIPAAAILGASLITLSQRRFRRLAGIALVATVLFQAWQIRRMTPSGAGGYEAAAEHVVGVSTLPGILLDASVDTGYFVFFVRKHDPDGRFFVLRADKLFAPDSDIDVMLKTYGVHFVVSEQSEHAPPVRHQLRAALATDRFIERRRFPITTTNPEARGGSLVIYEFRDAQAPVLDAEVFMQLPLGNRDIRIRVRDLIRQPEP